MPERLRNVIVGGGIGGLAAALALSSAGLPVTLLERVARPADVGAGIALHPNGLAVLYGLGLREHLRRTAFSTREGTLGIGSRRYTLPVPDYGDGLDHALALPRARLYQVLREAIAARGADLRFGHEVLGAAPDGRVEVRAPDGGVYEIDADVVVGADGIGSAVRDGAEFGVRRTATPGIAVRALLPGDPFGGRELELWTEEGLAVGAPMGDGTSYLALSASRGPMRRAMTEGDLATLRRLAGRILPDGESLLASVRGFGDLLVNPIVTVTCERWQDGRLALLGDAAHAMTPHLGQGANSALLDAYVLVEELARDQARPAAIARYASRRRPGVTRVQRMSRTYMAVSENTTMPVVRQARDVLMAALLPLAGRRSPLDLFLQENPARTYAAVRRLVPSAPR
jgi:2-polyprenyl-6-methoxyphenol hydroxylase-like FAD-dependent oxidoreductase